MIIYRARNIFNNKIYIGKTKQSFKKRISDHKYDAIHKRRLDKFHKAIIKYGFENFEWEIIAKSNTHKNLLKLERRYIIFYNAIDNGYNTRI